MKSILITFVLFFSISLNAEIKTLHKPTDGIPLYMGACAVFENKDSKLHFCALDVNYTVVHTIYVTLTGKSRKSLNKDEIIITQKVSKIPAHLKSFASQEVNTENGVSTIHMVEIPFVFIKHLREGIPISVSFASDTQKHDFLFTKEQLQEIRMISWF